MAVRAAHHPDARAQDHDVRRWNARGTAEENAPAADARLEVLGRSVNRELTRDLAHGVEDGQVMGRVLDELVADQRRLRGQQSLDPGSPGSR